MSEPGAQSDPIKVDWENVVRFIRQLSHDLRNDLNAAELQSAYLAEIAVGAEEKEEIKRLRQMLAGLGARLQKISATVAAPRLNCINYSARDFVEDLHQKLKLDFDSDAADVQWQNNAPAASSVEIDPQLLQWAVLELLSNAFRHRGGGGAGAPLTVMAEADASNFRMSLEEPKESFPFDPASWTRTPMINVSGGHYGLGLNRARNIIEAHDGQLLADYDEQARRLRIKISLPLAASAPRQDGPGA